MYKSDSLESIQIELEEGRASPENTLTQIVSFAKNTLGLELSIDQFKERIHTLSNDQNLAKVRNTLN